MKKENHFLPLIVAGISFCLCSCGEGKSEQDSIAIIPAVQISGHVINASLINKITESDTTISYDIEGISTEGCTADASYRQGKLYQCRVIVYGCSGQTKLEYIITDSAVKATQYVYRYLVPLEELECSAEIRQTDSLGYSLHKTTGKIINGAGNEESREIYRAVFKKIPFSLPIF